MKDTSIAPRNWRQGGLRVSIEVRAVQYAPLDDDAFVRIRRVRMDGLTERGLDIGHTDEANACSRMEDRIELVRDPRVNRFESNLGVRDQSVRAAILGWKQGALDKTLHAPELSQPVPWCGYQALRHGRGVR